MGEIARALGTPFMPWQQYVADIVYEIDPDTGQLWYTEDDLTVPRQSGKTTWSLARMVHRATRFGSAQTITYTAQDRNHARQKWEDEHVSALERTRFASGFRVRKTNGNEAILWRNGSKHSIDAPTATAGHGATLDLGIIDEAWARRDNAVEEAMRPAMITRPSKQLGVMSTAGNEHSVYLYGKVIAGRRACEAGDTGRTAYFEWSATDDDDPEDPETWRRCMPALGYTISEDAIRAELAAAKRDGKMDLFLRSFLNRWVKVPILGTHRDAPIPLEWWDACVDPDSEATGQLTFGVDLTPDRSTASIVVAARAKGPNVTPGDVHVEVVDTRPGDGTDWVVPALLTLTRAGGRVAVHLAGPAGSLETALRKSLGSRMVAVSDREMIQGCGQFHDAVRDRTVRHPEQESIRAGLDGAVKEKAGDAWKWSRRSSAVDLSTVVAATVAHRVHLAHLTSAPRRIR